MGLGRLARLFRTLRHLRAEQIAYRLYYRLARPLVAWRAMAPLPETTRRPWPRPWSAPQVMPAAQIEPGVFTFLGERGRLQSAQDWNAPDRSKLWLYNLHYLDDLNALDADAQADRQTALIQRWIDDNPPLAGNGWEPYPLSLRIVNLVKWMARQPTAPAAWLTSLARQAQALAVQEERHLLANHLFANGKALTFVGAFLDGPAGARWLRQGLRILDQEVAAQFLPDGGHFELSPMYHATLLWDLCDLVNLAEHGASAPLTERADDWRRVIERGLTWLEAMCHPDGEIAFFNDAAFGIAPPPRAIRAYAESLGAAGRAPAPEPLSAIHLADTGYVSLTLGPDAKALLDVARVGPDAQPGHAHADTLSFELSLRGRRVLVNSGTSVYGEGAERRRQRGTVAHNTVEIAGRDSSEVWAGFRVGRRARPLGFALTREAESLRVECAHDGYRDLPGAPLHRRQWRFSRHGVQVIDSLSSPVSGAIGRFHLHPDVRLERPQTLRLADGTRLHWSVSGGRARLVDSTWHPRFGARMPSHCLEVVFEAPEVVVEFTWDGHAHSLSDG